MGSKRFTLLVLLSTLLFTFCKENQNNSDIAGQYSLTGTSRFVFDAFGTYSEYTVEDTCTFTITKSGDSYVLMGAVIKDNPNYTIKLDPSGTPLPITINGDSLFIPFQYPFSGSSLSIEGFGTVGQNMITLSYQSHYRGQYRIVTMEGIKE